MRKIFLYAPISLFLGVNFGNFVKEDPYPQSADFTYQKQINEEPLNIYISWEKLFAKYPDKWKVVNSDRKSPFSQIMVKEFDKLGSKLWKEKYFSDYYAKKSGLNNVVINQLNKSKTQEYNLEHRANIIRIHSHILIEWMRPIQVALEFERIKKDVFLNDLISSHYRKNYEVNSILKEADLDLKANKSLSTRTLKWTKWIEKISSNNWWFNIRTEEY